MMDSNDDLGRGRPKAYTYSIDIHKTGHERKEIPNQRRND